MIGEAVRYPLAFHTVAVDVDDLRLAAVYQVRLARIAEPLGWGFAVAGSADAVARPDLDPLRVVETEICRGIARGPEPTLTAARAFQHHMPIFRAHDRADVARATAEHAAVEDDGVARLVAPYVGGLRARQAAVHEAVERMMRDKPYPEQGYRSAMGVISLARQYEPERVEAACERALTINAVSYSSLTAILRSGLDRAAPEREPLLPLPAHDNIRGASYYR